MVDLRLIWLGSSRGVEKITILGQRNRRRELVTFRRLEILQSLLEGEYLE
jgi:hypothetical protein